MKQNRRYHPKLLVLFIMTLHMGFALAQASYSEAPSLTLLVESGQLPPVDERLPDAPMVVPVVERIGDYGGTWRSVLLGASDRPSLVKTIGYEHLMRWNPEWTEAIPNVAESVEANETSTEFTFRLRPGMKWSDGEPFTADDIVFWYEDVALNEELSPGGVPSWMIIEGEPVVVEKLDSHTVVFRFAAPHGLFLQLVATPSGADITMYPRHYLERFHIKYNAEGIEELVREAGANDWVTLFQSKVGGNQRWSNSELPTLHGWILTTALGEGNRIVAERNPYYFKVDPEGNQLPYIDRVVFDVIADAELAVLKVLAGELDMQDRHIANLSNRALFFDHMETGDFRFFTTIPARMNTTIISLNLTHNDPIKREIFQNKDFRIGLSHAINRQEIIDLVFIGQGEPFQAAPRPESPFYNERLAKQYTEYDIDLANEYLDRAGYTERDAGGFRLGPDGRRISFVVETIEREALVDPMELIQGYWREVGIDMQLRVIDLSLFQVRRSANEHDVIVWQGGGGMEVILEPQYYFPSGGESNFAILWRDWYLSGGTSGEEPPAEVKRQMDLYDQLKATASEEQQAELMRQILEISIDQFYAIGVNLEAEGFGIVRNNFRNVPEVMPFSWLYPHPAPTNPEQYFIIAGGQ